MQENHKSIGEQFEDAKFLITDTVNNWIHEVEEINGEMEERESIEHALNLILELAEESIK